MLAAWANIRRQRCRTPICVAPSERETQEPAKAAPNNYRSDRVSGDPSVIARSPCDEAIQGHNMRGPSNPDGRMRPLDCFASLAMTDRELAHLFMRVA
jgi:hypothetical protein